MAQIIQIRPPMTVDALDDARRESRRKIQQFLANESSMCVIDIAKAVDAVVRAKMRAGESAWLRRNPFLFMAS